MADEMTAERWFNETGTKVRFDLIDEQILWAEAEEAKGPMSAWNQNAWQTDQAPCGTAYCIAGHVARLNGGKPIYEEYDGETYLDQEDVEVGGAIRSIPLYAAEVLGLEVEDYDYGVKLFVGYNTIADLKIIRDGLAQAENFPLRWAA